MRREERERERDRKKETETKAETEIHTVRGNFAQSAKNCSCDPLCVTLILSSIQLCLPLALEKYKNFGVLPQLVENIMKNKGIDMH